MGGGLRIGTVTAERVGPDTVAVTVPDGPDTCGVFTLSRAHAVFLARTLEDHEPLRTPVLPGGEATLTVGHDRDGRPLLCELRYVSAPPDETPRVGGAMCGLRPGPGGPRMEWPARVGVFGWLLHDAAGRPPSGGEPSGPQARYPARDQLVDWLLGAAPGGPDREGRLVRADSTWRLERLPGDGRFGWDTTQGLGSPDPGRGRPFRYNWPDLQNRPGCDAGCAHTVDGLLAAGVTAGWLEQRLWDLRTCPFPTRGGPMDWKEDRILEAVLHSGLTARQAERWCALGIVSGLAADPAPATHDQALSVAEGWAAADPLWLLPQDSRRGGDDRELDPGPEAVHAARLALRLGLDPVLLGPLAAAGVIGHGHRNDVREPLTGAGQPPADWPLWAAAGPDAGLWLAAGYSAVDTCRLAALPDHHRDRPTQADLLVMGGLAASGTAATARR